jgi:hypothetical protein
MSERVHLFDLRERTSAKGTRYLSGWLGKASVVAFLDREADELVWQVYLSTPAPRSAGSDVPRDASRSPFTPRPRHRRSPAATVPAGVLDDDVSDL